MRARLRGARIRAAGIEMHTGSAHLGNDTRKAA